MPFRSAGLGLKLNLSLLAFFLVLGAATLGVLAYGFNRTQDNATERSREALEELGQLALQAVASGAVEEGGVQFESASEIGQRAARFMDAYRQTGADTRFDTTRLARTDSGLYYDPNPDRISDVVGLPNIDLADPAVQDELDYAAALDADFEALYESFEDEVGGRNFDPVAIGFTGLQNTGRYFPPIGIHEVIPPDLDISGLLERTGPSGNPARRTTWTRPYEDALGQGLVVTAETPVYEGDTYRGVLQVDLLITRLIDQINGIKPTPGGFAFYVDVTGELLHTDAYDLLTNEATTNPEFAAVLEGMTTADGSAGTLVDPVVLDGREFFIAHGAMPSLGGSFAVAAPVSEITAEAAAITAGIDEEGNRTLLAMSAALGALFLAGLAGAGYLNRRVLLNPIGALLQGTRAVGAGDLNTDIEIRSSDELGDLATGFNSMVSELRARNEALARESEERQRAQSELGALVTAMDDVVIVFDGEGRCLRVAPTSAPLPFARPNIEGRLLEEFVSAAQATLLRERVERTLSTGQKQTVEYPIDSADGRRWFSAAITPLGPDSVVYVARDVTERVQAERLLEERVDERTRELQLLLDVSQNVASTLDISRLAERILEQLRVVIGFDGAAVLLSEGTGVSILEGYIDPASDEMEAIAERWFAGPPGGTGRIAMERRTPIVVSDIHQDEALAAWAREVPGRAATGRSWLSVPLVVQDRVLGVLNLWSAAPGAFGQHHADLALTVANQAAVAIENARLFQQASVVAAVEERQRLARELHDSVSQALYGIALGAQTARQLIETDPSKAAQPIDYILSLTDTGLAEMRALIFELRPESLATEGLVSALEKQAAATRARYNLAVELNLSAEPDASLATKEALYRVAQEAMHNTMKHAHAHTITLGLSAIDGSLRLEVADDGHGFDASADFPGHLGLRSMRERIEALGGTLVIESSADSGTRLVAIVP